MADTPNIRFKGFTDNWELRKFSDFTYLTGKRNKCNLDFEPYAITNEHGFIPQSEAHDEFGYMKDADRKAYNIVSSHSFAYNPARINVGSIGYYEGADSVIVSSLYEVFQTVDYVDDKFLWYWFKSEEFLKWIERLQEGSVRLYFYYDKLCECCMLIPSLNEQKKIASFLDSVDYLITLHQHKYDETKELKKYMLQKMFPQNGKKIPEIRFAGFTDDWELCKLIEEELSIDTGKSKFISHESGKYEILGSTSVIGYDDSYDYEGDFLLIARVGANAGELYRYFGKVKISDNTVFIQGEQLDFIYYLLLNFDIKKLSFGTGQPLVKASELKEQKILMPVFHSEREKIGIYFRNLDHLITLHQRKLEELKEVKKFMLQNMFPQKG